AARRRHPRAVRPADDHGQLRQRLGRKFAVDADRHLPGISPPRAQRPRSDRNLLQQPLPVLRAVSEVEVAAVGVLDRLLTRAFVRLRLACALLDRAGFTGTGATYV